MVIRKKKRIVNLLKMKCLGAIGLQFAEEGGGAFVLLKRGIKLLGREQAAVRNLVKLALGDRGREQQT